MPRFRRFVALSLILSLAGIGLPLPAQAGMISTPSAASSDARERVTSFLERQDVQQRLLAYGVSPADAKARVASLSDQEAAQLAGKIDSLPAGGDGGAIIFAAVLVFVILLITDILGFTHIFPFTKPIK